MKSNKSFWMLLFILILGASLRMYNLDAKSLWYDETSSIANALKGFNFILQPIYSYKPLYILLLKGWTELFGIGSFASRMLSVLFGVFSIPLIYKIGRDAVSKRVGLISAFLLSISCFHIYHSQQVRPYTFLVFLVLLSFNYFIKFLGKEKKSYLIINSLSNVLILSTHPYGASIVLTQVLYAICSICRLATRPKFKRWFLFQLPVLLVAGILFAVIAKAEGHLKSVLWWACLPGVKDLIETFKTLCYGGPRYGLNDVRIQTCPLIVAQALTLILGILFTKGLYVIFKNRDYYRVKGAASLTIMWLFVPIISAFLFSYMFFPVYFTKQLLILLPAFCLTVAVGICYRARLFPVVSVLSVVLLLNIFPLCFMYSNDVTLKWDKVITLMREHGIKEDSIIIVSTAKEVIPFFYYFSDTDKEALREIDMFGKIADGKWQSSFRYKGHYIITIGKEIYPDKQAYSNYITADFEENVLRDDILNSGRQIWLLVSIWSGEEYHREIMAGKLSNYFKKDLEIELEGVKVFCFER